MRQPRRSRRKPSNPLSKALRPFVEARPFRFMVGAHLVVAIVLVHGMGSVGGSVPLSAPDVAVLSHETIQVLTETTFRFPIEVAGGYSQGFHRFHPGVDIRAPRGSAIYPIAAGTVTGIETGRWGYGHKLEVQHDTGFISVYAHLGPVNVKLGEAVTKEVKLGEVGMTGWTTGPHLHLEIWAPEGYLNPKQVLPLTTEN